MLAVGPRPELIVRAAADRLGISARTLKRARADLGVVAKHRGFGRGSAWWLELPAPKATSAASRETWRPYHLRGEGLDE